MVSCLNKSKPSEMEVSFGANNISNSYMDLSFVKGIQKKVNTAPATEATVARMKSPSMSRIWTRTGNACKNYINYGFHLIINTHFQ